MNQNPKITEMKRREAFKRLINLSLAGICLLMEILIFTYIYLKYLYPSLNNILELNYWFNGYLLQEVVYALMLFFFSKMYGGLRIGFLKNSEIIFSQIFATVIVNLFTYAQMSLMVTRLFYTVPFLEMTLAQILVIIVWINIANRIYQRVFPPRKLLLVHGNRPIQDICRKFEGRKDKYTIVECVNIRMKMDKLKRK